MNSANYPVYDFLTASKVERSLSAALKPWMTKFNARLQERWSEFSSTSVRINSRLINALSFDAARARWTCPTVAAPIRIKGRDKNSEVGGLILAHCADITLLMMEILSEHVNERPKDREPTSVEITMCELFFQTAVSVLGEAWPDKETLPVTLGELDFQPNNSRLFSPSKEILTTGFEIFTSSSLEVGTVRFEWVFAKSELMNLLDVKPRETQTTATGKINPELVSQIQVELEAILGSTELAMSSLLQLTPGAMIRLDQRVDEPLELKINGTRKLTGWPGHSNHRPCVMIESVVK